MKGPRAAAWILGLAVAGLAASIIPWEDLTEADWLYATATRFTQVDGHQVHYPTPTAQLARLLATGKDAAALRHLAEARLALGDRPGALEAMERWARDQGPPAWAEFARWAAARQEPAAALKAALRALPGLPEDDRRRLADERILWAERHPELADPIALIQARSELFPGDGPALERWVRALEQAGRLAEAERALAGSQALDPERRLLLSADLRADHGDRQGAFRLLDDAVARPWSLTFRMAYAVRVDQAAAEAPTAWRATLEHRFDSAALVRLCTWFQGRHQGGGGADLLRQTERRYGKDLTRPDRLLMARLYGELDAVPEAFREALAAAHAGTQAEQTGDLAGLARLALRAGGRPLAWGNYNDEPYRWVANLDRTPGFWTGGVAFLLTGVAWRDTLDRLEDGSVPERTFATARALADALAQRAPADPQLPALRVAIMERYVERGEGRAALDLLPLVETTDQADEARRVALLAAQTATLPRTEEARLFKARLRRAAPDGSRSPEAIPAYQDLLHGALARMDYLDPSHRAALDLILAELDRLPDAETLWLDLATRLEGWNLDDDLGPRYRQALDRFQGPGVWAKAARWYARRKYQGELQRLASDVAARFRGSALFQRADAAGEVTVAAPGRPAPGRARMVLWADWVRLKALERFPHSPLVFREAARLMPASVWDQQPDSVRQAKVVVPDALVRERRWAILFADAGVREAWFQEAMGQHALEAKLTALESKPPTPVDDLLLFEGWARLSRFERAAAPADRLAASYPGDGALAQRVLSLHRSLNGLGESQAAAAQALVARTAPALEDAAPLWTELGEMAEERGRPGEAVALWRNLLAREPRDPGRIAQLATLLWDYGHDREALAVVEAGRKALARPRFYAFETGVLRENLRDLDGAVREYLEAVRPEKPEDYTSWYYQDQRSLRRLAQLLGREPVFRRVAQRIQRLTPGNAEDERELAAYFPLATLAAPDPRTWDDDDWIAYQDQPTDLLGRSQRQAARAGQSPAQAEAIRRMGDLLLAKTLEMVPRATSPKLLDFAGGQEAFVRGRCGRDQLLDFQDGIMARKAQLAPSEEERVGQEAARAQWLAGNGRVAQADAVWAGLGPRIARLPEGTARIQAEAQRAGYLERTQGIPAAAREWRRLSESHPWSLGLLEARLAFLGRAGLGEEGRALLEQAAAKAGSGYREDLLNRLAQTALEAADLPRARRAAEQLLALDELDDTTRLGAVHLLARVSFRAGAWDPAALVRAQEPRLQPSNRPELYHQLAQAADLERAPALDLWLRTLSRRSDLPWMREAAQSAARTGQDAQLLAFCQRQRESSPRDLRWIVAVRDLRRFQHDVPGAIEAARAAVRVRPDDENLWRAAADLLVRADRVREAADFLEEWQRPRPADEGVARWRAGLYAQCGDAVRALAVEQGTLAAFAREAPGKPDELAERRARAADRLLQLGLPDPALRLLSPRGDGAELARTRLSAPTQVELALRTGQLPRLLEARKADTGFLATAGTVLARQGRPEPMEAVLARLVPTLLPAGVPDAAALARWWPLIDASGQEPALRAALAQGLLRLRPGPWQTDPSFPLVQRLGAELIQPGPDGAAQRFRAPDLSRLWCWDLARRGQGAQLLAFTAPRWRELLAQVRGTALVSERTEPPAWIAWMQEDGVLPLWAKTAAAQPEMTRQLAEVMGERPRWDRFWALAARHWPVQPLVAALPEDARTRWFSFWRPEAADPVLRARQRTVEQVGLALGRLLQGAPGAAGDPLVARLRGPRTVGELLGQDARWLWPEFAPRADTPSLDQGDDRIQGQGADRGRLPGALWGEHPGPAWYVLETLARYRQGDPTAPRLPLVAPAKGTETAQTILAVRLARTLGDLPLALELAGDGPARDRAWLEAKLSLLVAADRAPEAAAGFRAYLRSAQSGLTEAAFKDLAALAGRLGLPGPMACLDPGQPVSPVLLAYLHDRYADQAGRFRTSDDMSFRTALASRWSRNPQALTPSQLRFWLRELWAMDVIDLPQSGLASLGPVWPHAAPWLRAQPPPERLAALRALERALDPAVTQPPLLAQLTGPDSPDPWRRLALRIRLSRGETGPALALLDARLAELLRGQGLTWEPPEDDLDDPDTYAGNTLVANLRPWLEPFRTTRDAAVLDRFRSLLAQRRAAAPATADEWRLAFRLCPPAQAPELLRQLEWAWFRAELDPGEVLGLLPAMAAVAPGAVPGWLARCPNDAQGPAARLKAKLLISLAQPAQAARILQEARRRGSWNNQDEADSFGLWRRSALPDPPAYWQGALAVWRGADLGARLKAHPLDRLAARYALTSLEPLAEDSAGRAALALGRDTSYDDSMLLQLRADRWLLSRSPGSVQTVSDPGTLTWILAARSFPAPTIDAALADLARHADAPQAQAIMELLAERGAGDLQALAAARRPAKAKTEPYRMQDGRPAPIRPRDLTWAMLVDLLRLEGAP